MTRRISFVSAVALVMWALVTPTANAGSNCVRIWDRNTHAYIKICKKPGKIDVGIVKKQPGGATGPGSQGGTSTITVCIANCPPTYVDVSSCAGVPKAQWNTCTGPATGRGCPVGQAQYDTYQVVNGRRTFIITYCATPGGPPPPSPPALVQQWLKTFTPDPAVGTIQPGPGTPLPFTLDLFAQTTAPIQQPGTLSQGGTTVTIHIDGARYTWKWGDGSPDKVTTSVGGPYPTGDVTHKYAKPGKYSAVLTVEWHVTYDVAMPGNNTTGNDFGYINQPGQQAFPVNIVEAHAVLTS